MALVSWREDYRVGEPLVDAEHRYLFDLINEFQEAYLSGQSARDVLSVLTRLVAYAESHFQHEEALMQRASYPRLEQQKRAHEQLYDAIYRLNERLAGNGLNVDRETMRFLKRWLVDHILQEDLAFGDFLKAREAFTKTADPAGSAAAAEAQPRGRQAAE